MTTYLGDASDETVESLSELFDIPAESMRIAELIAVWRGCGNDDIIEVFYRGIDDLYYIVHASHCSCYGYEGQWGPEVIPPAFNRFALSQLMEEVIKAHFLRLGLQ